MLKKTVIRFLFSKKVTNLANVRFADLNSASYT